MTWISILATFFLFAIFIYVYGNWKKHKQIPGPFPLPLIGSAHLFFNHSDASKTIYRWMELVKYYKGTLSLWIGSTHYVMLSEPDHIHTYCTSPLLLDHSEMYTYFRSALGEGLFTTNGAAWKTNRKAWAPSFHPSVLRHFVDAMKKHTEVLVEVIEKETSGPEFPSFLYIRECMTDLIFETTLDFDRNGQRVHDDLIDQMEPCNEILYSRIFKLYAQNEQLFRLTPNGRQFQKAMAASRKYLFDLLDFKIEQYSREPELQDDDWRRNIFIRQLLSVRNISKEQMYDEIMTAIVTGYETVTRTLGFVLLMLGAHPEVQENVLREDKEVQKRLAGRELTVDDLNNYEYLEQVIKETLRIFPTGPVIGRTAAEDMKIGNFDIKKGTNVMMLIIATHRNPEIFPNPLVFNPENFSPEKSLERHPYSFVPFSSGPRGCIGNKFAMLTMKVVIPALVRNYRIISNKGVNDIKLLVEVTMRDADGFQVRIEKR